MMPPRATLAIALVLLAASWLAATVIHATSTVPWWQITAAESLRGAAP